MCHLPLITFSVQNRIICTECNYDDHGGYSQLCKDKTRTSLFVWVIYWSVGDCEQVKSLYIWAMYGPLPACRNLNLNNQKIIYIILYMS